jgi:DNA-binding MarR family transcriptional regulator
MNRVYPSLQRRPRTVAVLAWLRLVRAYLKMDRVIMEHLRQWNLSGAQFDILAHLGAAPGISQQELAEVRLTTKGNLSQLLDRMETAGLIQRVRERHVKRISLTETGQRLFDLVVPAHEALIDEHLAALTPAEQTQLLGLLRALDRSLSPG